MSRHKLGQAESNKTVKFAIYTGLIICSIIQIFPLFWLALFSLKTNREIVTKSAFAWPEQFKYQNYVLAWTEGKVDRYFGNSVFVAFSALIVTLLLGAMIAYAITRMRFKYCSVVFYLFMAGMMIPIHASLIPLFIILKNMGLLRSYLSIILPYIGFGLPLAIFVFSNFLKTIPFELEQASFIDGCGVLRSFFMIIMPVIKPAFATVGIFTFMTNWNEFIMASTFLQDVSKKTLPIGLMVFQGQYSAQWGPMGAAIMIASLPVLIIYLFFSDAIEKSFAAGAILK